MVLDSKVGWSVPVGNKMFFFESDKQNKCKNVVDNFIKGICHYRELITGKSWEETCAKALADDGCRKDMAYRLQKTTYELRETDEKHMMYISLSGDNFGGSYDIEEVIIIEEV